MIVKENITLKQDLIKKTEDMENLMKKVITEATQSLVTSFVAQQASHEKQTNSLFDTFQEQIRDFPTKGFWTPHPPLKKCAKLK